MNFEISEIKLENLADYYRPGENRLRWPMPFILPGWLAAWWKAFGAAYKPLVLVAQEGSEIVGIAPLKVKDGIASFIGDNDVCDYLDFVTAPGKEDGFADTLLDYMPAFGVKSLVLETLRPDSVAGHNVAEEARRRGGRVAFSEIDVSFEMELPKTWEDYLASLESKQRRDVERKMRQLDEMAEVRFRVLRDDEVGEAELHEFFKMMTDSRRDKARFLTDNMRSFFEGEVKATSGYGLLRLGFLEVGVARVAGILYFEYNATIYLYNSGYMPQYAENNAGLVSKLYCIKRSIEEHKKVFDFLKGPEVYKSRLGGCETILSRCVIDLS